MARATWNGVVLAESDATHTVEGNVYFPPESVNREFFVDSDKTTRCIWKGKAHYYHLRAGEQEAENAAWYYPAPQMLARKLKDHVAFYGVVEVTA